LLNTTSLMSIMLVDLAATIGLPGDTCFIIDFCQICGEKIDFKVLDT